tara:strand:- start:39 stop:302 length:264 start_codon:yes stop_codon:yes gene_type:complete
VIDFNNSTTFSYTQSYFQGSSYWGLKSSTDVGKPWFNDSRYWSNTSSTEIVNLISSGWANREYTNSEVDSLRDKLKDIYYGTSRGTT